MGGPPRKAVRLRTDPGPHHPRPLRGGPRLARPLGQRLHHLGDPLRRRLVEPLARPLPGIPDGGPLRPRPPPLRGHVHRRDPPPRPALLREPLGEGGPGRLPGRHGTRVGPAPVARAPDLGTGQPPGRGQGPGLGCTALRARVRPVRRADRRPGDRLLRHRLLPHRGTDGGRPATPRRRTPRPPHHAPLPQEADLGLRHAAGPRLPRPLRRRLPDARRGRGRHLDGPRSDGRGDPRRRGRGEDEGEQAGRVSR